MKDDILFRLKLDPGQRTLGQLLQDREAAAHEILRLRTQLNSAEDVIGRARNLEKKTVVTPALSLVERPHAFRLGTLIRMSEVCEMLGLSRSTIYNLLSEGNFPQPLKMGARAVRWHVEQIEAWRDEHKPKRP